MSKQPPPAPTASVVGPCPTVIQTVGRPGTGSFTQHQRTTRPLPIKNKEHYEATMPVEHKSAPQNTYRTESVQESNLNISGSLQSETIQDQFQEDHTPETINVTRHKEADYQSSKKKLSSRKKNRNVSLWKANIRKKARTEGREYNTKERKAVPKRSVKPQNCEKRRFKCNTKFTEVEREQIFQT